jgi:tetratricopeptide (TPR) repeat protein
MKLLMSRPARCLVLMAVLSAFPAAAQSVDSLSSARELYSAAAYEDALAMLNRLRAPGGLPSHEQQQGVEQYRALCLLALGRAAEAQQAIEIVVAAAPSYQPSEVDASPRVRSAFSEVRRRMLPTIIQQEYALAKGAFDRKDYAIAAETFKRVLDMLADSDVGPAAAAPPLSDLRTLAGGFRDLSLSAVPPPLPAVASAPPPPTPAAPVRPAVPKVYGGEDTRVVPPVILRQGLPSYTTRTTLLLQGTLAVVVSERGDVESAAMLQSVNPIYDRMVMESVKQWRYRPATLDGVPVKFRRIVQIKVTPSGQ